MKITKIEIQKNNKNRVNLFVDDNFFCGLSLETIVKNHIKENQEISNLTLEYLKEDSEFLLAMGKAGSYLSKVQKTEKELKDYLLKKGFELDIVKRVLEKMKAYGYIDDFFYAKNFVKSKCKSRGAKKIAFELRQKGICDEIVNDSVSKIQNESETAQKLLDKYLKNKPRDVKTKQKAYRFLFSKGFSNENVSKCLNNFFAEE
jgi:regulatory protein